MAIKINIITSGIDAETADKMRQELIKALPVACDLFDTYWELSFQLEERIGTWGDDQPAYYLASTGTSSPSFDSDILRLMGPNGQIISSFPARSFRDYLTHNKSETSYAGYTSVQGEVLRANSLARMNIVRTMGTPLADQYLSQPCITCWTSSGY